MLDASIGTKLEAAKELIGALNRDIDSIVLAEASDLLKLCVEAVDQD